MKNGTHTRTSACRMACQGSRNDLGTDLGFDPAFWAWSIDFKKLKRGNSAVLSVVRAATSQILSGWHGYVDYPCQLEGLCGRTSYKQALAPKHAVPASHSSRPPQIDNPKNSATNTPSMMQVAEHHPGSASPSLKQSCPCPNKQHLCFERMAKGTSTECMRFLANLVCSRGDHISRNAHSWH